MFGQIFDQMFGQVFGQRFGQVFDHEFGPPKCNLHFDSDGEIECNRSTGSEIAVVVFLLAGSSC